MRSSSVLKTRAITFIIVTLLLTPVWANEETGKVQNEKHIYTVIEFESTFMNRRKEKVLKVLGEPDARSDHKGKEVWKYFKIIKDQEKLWDQNIMFDFGRVNMMWGTRPTADGNKQ